MTEKDIYDKRKFYKTKLEPLIHELKLQCNMEHMPMFVTVAVKNDKAGTEYASDMVLAGSGTELENNRISKLLLELNNIHQKYPDYIEKDIREISQYLERLNTNIYPNSGIDLADNKIISKDEHLSNLDIAKASSKIADNASARFLTISESKVGELFNERGVDIYKALKEKAIIIFVLNPLLYPETAQAMGRLILIDTKKAVSKLFNSENRKFFIFDEINVYASSVLVDLINKSRSANITCIPATQSLSDLENETGDKFKNQIIENCNNYIVLRQNSFKSAEEWAKTIGTKQTMLMTYQMNEEGSTKKGSSRREREFIVHPDEIKSQGVGEAIYISRDRKQCDRIKVFKPF